MFVWLFLAIDRGKEGRKKKKLVVSGCFLIEERNRENADRKERKNVAAAIPLVPLLWFFLPPLYESRNEDF